MGNLNMKLATYTLEALSFKIIFNVFLLSTLNRNLLLKIIIIRHRCEQDKGEKELLRG